LVLFNNKHSENNQESEGHEYEELIEQHRAKTKQMLNHNAQLWENEWRYCSDASEIASIGTKKEKRN
jgi:hypothetical protein